MDRPLSPALRAGVMFALLALLAFGVAAPAAAEETTCTGTIGAETHDNIRVPDGASCTLDGTTAEGNVVVGSGARLLATGVTVGGSIQAEGADDVTVSGSTVGGSVQLMQGGGAAVSGTQIDADLQLESNRASLAAERNDIGGNLQAFQNSGGVHIADNTIDGNLQCNENQPAPTGGGNVVRGSAEDQCAHLAGSGSEPPPPAPARATSRLAGPDRFATAVAITRATYPHGAEVVYLARADEPADALAGSSLRDGPILLVPACGTLPPIVAEEIRRLDPQRVVALGGPAAVCDPILEAAAAA